MDHVHVDLIDCVKIFAVVVIGSFLWRTVAAHNSDNAVGQGMAFIL